MVRLLCLLAMLVLAACSGRAWNTTVANSAAVRTAMLSSVVIGQTTDRMFVTRWGRPTQIVREGGQESYIYRDIVDAGSRVPVQFGDSRRYVIVDFQYGIATGARSSETVGCRATFPPRPPSYVLDNPSTVRPVNCGPAGFAGRDGTGRKAPGQGVPGPGKY